MGLYYSTIKRTFIGHARRSFLRCDAWPHYRTSQVFSGFVDHLKQDGKLKTQYLYRFEAASLQDMVTKFEPNLGFEKSFISVLALKVLSFCSHVRSVILIPTLNKTLLNLEESR